MLAVEPFRNGKDGERSDQSFSIGDDFTDCFSGDNLLESIDFDDLFEGMEDEHDHVLPPLEIMDPEINLADFSVSGGGGSESMNITTTSLSCEKQLDHDNSRSSTLTHEEDKISGSGSGSGKFSNQGDEIVSKRDKSAAAAAKEGADKGKKSSKNNPQGKRKVKVDWTPELHRRFVQAVEQLGVDKAVPSRILELMGIDCLTRHNIASHLQKYRSHRKHLLAREAEAANWTQRRQMYSHHNGGSCKREMMNTSTSPWLAPPTIGFPPAMAPPPVPHFRPLHVWGHPSVDQSLRHVWPSPKHVAPNSRSPPPPAIWPPPAAVSPHLPPDPSLWHSRHHHVPNSLPPGTHCFPPPARYVAPPVPGIPPPHGIYKLDPTSFVPTPPPTGQAMLPHHPIDLHPSKESIDAAIEDVLSNPWLPLPLGLKPPSTDSVVVELHRQGVEKIPPSTCNN